MKKIKWVLENAKVIYCSGFYIFKRFALKPGVYLLLFSVDKCQIPHVKKTSNSKILLIIHLIKRQSYLGIVAGDPISRDVRMNLLKIWN